MSREKKVEKTGTLELLEKMSYTVGFVWAFFFSVVLSVEMGTDLIWIKCDFFLPSPLYKIVQLRISMVVRSVGSGKTCANESQRGDNVSSKWIDKRKQQQQKFIK